MADWRFLRNVLFKALGLFLALNLLMIVIGPADGLGKISLYNHLFPGRERLPFGENSRRSYNLSLYNLDAMLASHELSGTEKTADEFRVFTVGDSSTWGTLLEPDETLAGQVNHLGLVTCDGKKVRAYNLGYPTLSLTKDLMILWAVRGDQPNLIIWPVTLESFVLKRQFDSPLAANNLDRIHALNDEIDLGLDWSSVKLGREAWWRNTFFGQRRELADWLRLQIYGVMWAATGIDQDIPVQFTPAQRDFKANDLAFHDFEQPTIPDKQLAYQLLDAGSKAAGGAPVLVVNEPVLISSGENSAERYNFYYPRWAYDQYRNELGQKSQHASWRYVDLWDLAAEKEFTNSAIHLTAQGESLMTGEVVKSLRTMICIR